MEINPNFKPGNLRPDATPAEVRNWRVGQVLSAVATSADRGGQADLRIGAQTYQAQVPFTVRPGDRMLLEVIRSGTTPLLRPLGAERSPDPVQAALRSALPRQAPLPPLLANLAQLADRRITSPVAAPVREVARVVFETLATDRQTGTADGLRRAIRDAGTQLEAKLGQLAAGKTPVAGVGDDFKAGLLRLREAAAQALRLPPPSTHTSPNAAAAQRGPEVRTMPLADAATRAPAASPPAGSSAPNASQAPVAAPSPGATARAAAALLPPLLATQPQPQGRAAPFPLLLEPTKLLQGLLQQVDSSLARLQLHQLASQPADGDQRQVWLLELPVRRDQQVDLWHLRIEREGADDGDESRRSGTGWTVKLAFDLDGLGPVQARVGLHGGLVSTAFWTERPGTQMLFQRHLEELRRQLQAAGLDVGGMSCQVGQPQPPAEPPPRSGILDEKA